MPITFESIAVGQCYLTDGHLVRRVLRALEDERVQYEWRGGRLYWKAGMLPGYGFALAAEKPIPCDWTPEEE